MKEIIVFEDNYGGLHKSQKMAEVAEFEYEYEQITKHLVNLLTKSKEYEDNLIKVVKMITHLHLDEFIKELQKIKELRSKLGNLGVYKDNRSYK